MTNSPAEEFQYSQFIWARHKSIRVLFHFPMILISKDYRNYRFLNLPESKRKKKAQKWASKFVKDKRCPNVTINEVVGRDDVLSLLIDAIDYHILRLQDKDPEFAKSYSTPPSKVFIFESDPGWGKKYLAKAIQREALERGVKEGIKVMPENLKSSDISSWLMGVSEKQLEGKMNRLFSTPSIIFIDNAQSFAEKTQVINSDIARESRRISETLERSLERLKDNPIRSLAILSTNNFANMPETIRLIAERINLNGMKELDLIEICRKKCEENHIDIDPAKLFYAISQSLRALGKSITTPSDINKSFVLAVNKVRAPFRDNLRSRTNKELVQIEVPKPTIDDFISVAAEVSAYTEEEVSTMVKETRQFTKPTERYHDIGGLHDVIGKVITEVKCSLNPQLAKQLGYEAPIGFLFYGPPGTGKTLLAKAIAGEEGAKIRVVSGSEVYQKEVGETERNIRSIFSEARKESPSIIIWDEIDAVAVKRGSRLGDPVHSPAITILLSELEGLKSGGGKVLFIGITNRKDIIDEALLNRLLLVDFTYPKNAEERREVLEVHLRKIKPYLSKDVTIEEVMKIFLQRTFSPRVVSYTIRSAVSERTKEIVASREMHNALEKQDEYQIKNIRNNYKQQLTHIEDFAKTWNKKIEEIFKMIALTTEDQMNYPVTLHHLKEAFDKVVKTEDFEELKEMQRIYRGSEAEIGKTYGLATLEGENEQNGIIVIVESEIFPKSTRSENPLVFGTVGESVKESAKVAIEFIREYYSGITDHDVDIHIITPSEGASSEGLKLWGPSAGIAIAVSIASAVCKIPLSPNICMTGKIELQSGVAGLVGGIHPKKGSGKIDIAADEKFEIVIIPTPSYRKLTEDYQEYIEAVSSRGTKIIGGKDFFEYMEIASGQDKAKIIDQLVSPKQNPGTKTLIIKGKYCEVNYSKYLQEMAYAHQVVDLADKVIPKVKSIHTGRSPDEKIKIILDRNREWPAATEGKTVVLNLDHFDKIAETYGMREADDGAIVHEIDHAILYAPKYDNSTSWLIEGIADYVRYSLGYQRRQKGGLNGSYPHFEEIVLSSSQSTADFIMFLQTMRSTIVKDLVRALLNGTYNEKIFKKYYKKTLEELIAEYIKSASLIQNKKV